MVSPELTGLSEDHPTFTYHGPVHTNINSF